MAKIIESIPNISEGRNKEVVEACVDQIRNTKGATLLDYSSDPSHNRTVITYMGSPEAVEEASVKLVKKAAELIDLTKHEGEHPRMGAVDVMPFVPIKDASEEDCIALSKAVGKRIFEEAGVPVFLYEKSATAEHRTNLAAIRKGQFEGMGEKVKDPQWHPDFGTGIHKTAGVIAVGARPPLIAYNLNLNTDNLEMANEIAKEIRESSGGLPKVKAIGIMLEERNIAQVSINMTDYTVTSLFKVTEIVKEKAKERGALVIGSELIGLCPMKALIDVAEECLMIEDFNYKVQVIENHLL
ncbi:MAG: glutamate formimidoyltransferase [Anaerovoracaceae bacterium]|nr:glutamate formimidoyltransferase [Clostridiales bacterium]